MTSRSWVAALVLALAAAPAARAGLYYSGEPLAELPSQWRGFLLDHRALRNLAVKPTAALPASPMRLRYEEAAAQLEKAARERKLTADERADLGALHVRLGELGKALDILRSAQRDYPDHYRIVSNLGTAWQLHGELDQAAACLQQAVRLAPGKLQRAEEHQLKLVRLRQRQARNAQELDDLFGVRYVSEKGQYEPGRLAAAERKKLPPDAVAVAQQLALWVPADGRLLWQLGELAAAHGDVKTAATIFDGCVTEFGMHAVELRRHRQLMRQAADALAQAKDDTARTAHEGHAGLIQPRSKRPLLSKLGTADLPPVSATAVNPLPWAVLAETTMDRQYRPTFARYLHELDNKQVSLTGFIQPLDTDLELNSFMLIEYPVGCWYCEMTDITGIVYVELPTDKTARFTRGQVKVTGVLKLNATDPENFLYTISKAKVSDVD
jgi:tetratricopeptide (TPR) repeat protein